MENVLVGKKVEQISCESPRFQKYVGRVSIVVESFDDENGMTHCRTKDDVWCPLRFLAVLD
jgi:hypothetical protein